MIFLSAHDSARIENFLRILKTFRSYSGGGVWRWQPAYVLNVLRDIIIQYCRSIIQMMWKNRNTERRSGWFGEVMARACVYVSEVGKMENLWNLWILLLR
jgi:hypothetical protein